METEVKHGQPSLLISLADLKIDNIDQVYEHCQKNILKTSRVGSLEAAPIITSLFFELLTLQKLFHLELMTIPRSLPTLATYISLIIRAISSQPDHSASLRTSF